MAEKKRHLFLTGEKGVGKSTLIKRFLERAEREGTVGGFLTVKSQTVFPGQASIHLLPLGRPLLPSFDNFLTFCGKQDRETAARFNSLGCAALSHAGDVSLLLMDELGPHEAKAMLFREKVAGLLDGPVPVLGVLQKADSPFLSEIRSHPAVKVLEITYENRAALTARPPVWQWYLGNTEISRPTAGKD